MAFLKVVFANIFACESFRESFRGLAKFRESFRSAPFRLGGPEPGGPGPGADVLPYLEKPDDTRVLSPAPRAAPTSEKPTGAGECRTMVRKPRWHVPPTPAPRAALTKPRGTCFHGFEALGVPRRANGKELDRTEQKNN